MSLMVSISGIRGIVGTTLTPQVIVRYVSAYAQYCNKGAIAIGRDGRSGGEAVAQLVAATLRLTGSDVLDLGICPTPTVALAVEKLKIAGGISITASHNPLVWNGLKFFSSTGLFLDAEENSTLWAIAAESNLPSAPWHGVGSYAHHHDFIEQHLTAVLSLPFIDRKALAQRRFKVVVDVVNAAGSICVPTLLERLGCEVVKLHCNLSGIFPHAPEPLPENLTSLCEAVRLHNADLGIAVDPDVDRLVLITEKGEPFGEEYTVATATRFILEKKSAEQQHIVVVNLSTTRAVDDIALNYDATVVRTPVGEINVAKKMKEIGAVVGGEGSGGVILPEVHYGRDALVGIALVLQHLLEHNKSLSELRASLPQYSITKTKLDIGSLNADEVLAKARELYRPHGKINSDDGVKIDFENSWIHLRKSNTEPIIRIIAEAPTMREAQLLVEECKRMLL